jgi:hypothetical protein
MINSVAFIQLINKIIKTKFQEFYMEDMMEINIMEETHGFIYN